MNCEDIDSLISAMQQSRVTTLEIKRKEQFLRLVLHEVLPVPVTDVSIEKAKVEHVLVRSKSIGSFLSRGIDDGLLPLELGMHVLHKEILGYVCHGPIRIIIDSPIGGILRDQWPMDGAVLGVEDAIFNLEPIS